ncbi:MAG: DUF3987 domain-containing protein [Clostridia bacterium]|nr:DUF3987 domain-containing protein [Clostridia bacterium]
MSDMNEFTFWRASCVQNPKNCSYPEKVIVRDAESFNEMARFDHVAAKYKDCYRSNDTFEESEVQSGDVDNDDVPNPDDWVLREDIHRIFEGVPHIISESKNYMKPKGTKPPAPRYHVFWKALMEMDPAAYAAFKERLHKHFPFLDPKALDAARYFDGTENPNAVFYPGTITINEFMDRLDAEEQPSAETIAEGTRNSTMFHFAVRKLKRYGNTEEARELFRKESDKCTPPLDTKELNGIWKSALKYYGRIRQEPGYVPPEQYNAPKEPQWEQPIPFEEVTLPAFPVDALPSRVRPYVEAVAETTQTPVDMAATAAIAVMASCMQGKYLVQAKADWTEPTNLYALIIAEPSERKSAVTSLMVKPVNLYEMEYNKQHAAALEKNRMQKRILEKRQRAIEDKVAKCTAEENELDAIVDEIARFKELSPMQLYVDDVTPEKLISVLAEHDGIASVISAEGGIFDQLAGGMYSKAVNIDVFLKGHAGDSIRIDRIGRNSESVESPALTLLFAVQPNVLSGLMQNNTFRGRGLTARFLYAMPTTHVGSRKYRTEPIPKESEKQYYSLIGNLLDEDSNPTAKCPEIITLSEEADKMLEAFATDLEPKLRTEYIDFSDWAGKLCGAVVRISGLLCRAEKNGCYAFLREPEPPVVDGATMQRAITLGQYYTEHAKAAYLLMGADPVVKQCKYVLKAIQNAGLAELSKRDIMRLCRSFKKAEELQPVLDRLCEYGYLALKPSEMKNGGGRPASQSYLVNPAVFTS